MLVLKRKVGETIMIGDDIEVVILEQDGDAVRIGIQAPKTVKVYRKEIFDEIKLANQSSILPSSFDSIFDQYRKTIKKDEI